MSKSQTFNAEVVDAVFSERDKLKAENAKLREVIDDITEVVEVSDPALVEFIAKRMKRARIEVTK